MIKAGKLKIYPMNSKKSMDKEARFLWNFKGVARRVCPHSQES
jgi:hypothetical protein